MTKLGKRGTIASGYLCALLATTALTSPLLLSTPAASADYIGTGGGDGHSPTSYGSSGAGAGGAGGTNGSGGTAPGGGGGGGYSGGYPGGGGGGADSGGGGGTYYGNAGSAGGGGAGGYGYLLTDGSTFTSSGDIIGGKGGNGGAGLSDYAQNSAGGGGGGGGGGSGIVVQGGGTITNTDTITGGDGGNAGGTAAFYLDAHPGAGGFGIRADNSTGVTITNSGNITGGSQGNSLSPNVVNIAGAGIYGQNITLYNTGGSIAGGVADLSVAAAIELTGGINALYLSGGTLQSLNSGDGIRTDAGTNTIELSGATINLAQSGAGLNIVGGANTLTFSSGSIAMGQEATGLQVGGGTGNIFNLSGGSIAPSYDNNSHTYHFYNYGIVVNGGSSTFNISAGTVAAGGGTTGIENSAVLLTSGTNVFNISGTANISNAAYSDLVDITGGTNTFNISGGSIVHANQGYTWSIKVSGGTNILNVTGGTLDPIYLGGGTNTLEGSGFSNSVTLASGAIAKVIAAGTDVAGITSFDNSGTLTVEDGRSISMTSFTNENGGALNLGTRSQLIATSLNLIAGSTITGAGSLSSGSAAYSLDSGSISASLAGSGGLTKTGSGILTLTGANTYTGGTHIDGGTLSIADGALGGGDVHMAQGTTIQFTGSSFTTHNNFFIDGDPVFDVASGTVQTIDGVIADDPSGAPGVVEKTGAGTLVLSGNNTYSGGTVISAGTLTMGSNTALGTGAVTLDGGTLSPSGAVFSNQIVVNGTGGTIDGASGGTISGAIVDGTGGLGTLTFSGGAILLSGSNSYASATTVSAGATLDAYQGLSINSDYTVNGHLRLDGSGGFFTVKSLSGTGDITSFGSGTVLFLSPASGQTATFDGTLSNGSNPFVNVLQLNFDGAGTQKITGANSYSGGTIITSGTLEIGNASALGTGAISFYAGTLKTDGAYTIANAITMSAAGGTIDSGGFNTTLSGAIADGTASGLLTLAGGGTFTLSGNNTSTGGLSLASGTLVTGGNGMGSGRITLGNGTTVKAADTFSHDNAITLAGGATLDVDGHQVTLNGVISDSVGTHGSLTLKDSIGNYNSDFLVLSGANTYSGGTTIAGLMTVYAQNDSAFGTGAVSVDNAFIKHGGSNLTLANDISIGNQLSVNADSGVITLNGVISESSPGGLLYLNGNVVVNGANTYSGGTTLANTVTAGNNDAFGSGEIFLYGTLQAAGGSALTIDNAMDLNGTGTVLGNGTTLTLSGEIFDDFSGPAALVIGAGGAADASTVVLSGDNSFTGGLTIAGGTVKAASSTALGDSGGTVTMNDGTALAYANGVDIANTLNFTGSAALSVASGDRATQSGDIGDDAPANPHTVTKTGAGTLVLSGSNNSSANVKLVAGTLEIASQGALGSGTYTFDGGTLRLDGGWTIGNDVRVLSGGTLDNGGNDIELSGDVSSDSTDGVLTLAGTGSVKISNYNNLSGGAAIGADATLEVAGASGMGAGDVSMASGSTVKFTTVSSAFTNHFLLDGYSNFDVASGLLTTTLSGVIADAPATTGTLVNAGTGTLVLSGANIYSGGTSLSDGILQIGIDTVGTPGNITSSAVGTGTISFHGGTLQAGGDYTVANAISLASGDGTVDANGHAFALTGIIGGSHVLTFTDSQGGGTITLSGANTYNGGTTIGSGVTALAGGDQAFGQSTIVLDGGTLGAVAGTTVSPGNTIAVGSVGGTILANGGTLNLSGTIVDVDPGNGGWLTLGKAGETGTVAISGTNIYAGGTIIAGGTVKVSGSSALGAGAIKMAGGTTLALTSSASLGNMLIVDDTTPTLNVGSGTATLSGGISELGSASGGFTKTGSGTLLLTGSSGNSGITNVSAGMLEIGDGAAASSSAYQVGQGATLAFDAQSLNYAQIGSLAGAGNVTSATLLDIGNSDNTTFSGVITTAGLNYNGSGILTLTGTGNHLGGVSICGCVSSGGITLSGGNANASSGVGVESGTFTVTAGAQFGTTRIVQGGGTIAISGNGTAVGATNVGVGIIGVYADGSTAPVFTVSDGAHVTSDFLMAGIAGGTVAPQITVTGANALLSLTNGVQLNDGTVLTVADGATLTTASVDLDTNASLVIGAGAAAGTVGDANTRIQGLSSGTSVVANFTGGATLDALLTGSVALNVQAGNLTLTNTLNDYGGGSTISAGAALTIRNNAVGTGNIVDNGTLVLDNNSAVTMANGISGSGGVTQNGDAAVTFDAAKTYSGRTVIGPASTLFLTGAGDISLSSAIEAHGTFDVSGVTATNVSVQALDGDGDVEIGNRTLVITGSGGLYSGMLSDGHAGGSLTLLGNQVLNGILSITGTTTLGAGSTLTVSGPDALGGGALKFLADSTLKFRGSGTYANAMDFAVGAPLFDVTGQTVRLSGAIGGPGDLAVTGNGTLILTNTANSYGGGTEVTGGATLKVDADGELGATASTLQLGDATTAGTLRFGGAFSLNAARGIVLAAGGGIIDTNGNDITIGQAIAGGGLTKAGAGNLILTGASSFSGPTVINAGTLSVNGAIASSAVRVNSGATLGGTGTVGATTVASGGTLAPGNSIGTLHVNGGLTFAAGSTYAADISPGTADSIAATSAASLGGTLAITQGAGTYTNGTDLTLLSASGVSGTFDSVTGASFTGLDSAIVYSATSVSLKLSSPGSNSSSSGSGNGGGAPATLFLFNTYGTTPNQIAAGTALAAGASTGKLYTAMGGVVSANTAGVATALGQAAGDIHASIRSAAIEDSRIIRNTVLGRLDQGGDNVAIWGSAFGGYGSIAGDGNAAAMHHDSAGIIAGADMPLSDGIRAGIAAAYSTDRAATTGHLGTASGGNGHIIGYAGWSGGAFDVRLGGDYGWGTAHIARQLGALGQTLAGRQDQQMGQVFVDAGYRITGEHVAFEPYADIAHVEATSGSFAESGGSAALSGGSATDGVTYGTLGARASFAGISLQDVGIAPKIDLGWRHAFDVPKPGQAVSFQDTGTSFTVLGVPLESDAAALQLGFDVTLTPGARLSLGYDGTFGSRVQNNAVRGAFQWRF